MNRVFLGEKIGGVAGAPVALKLIDARHSPQEGRLFDRECRILARLQHPGIARFLDGGATPDGARFLVMERIEGAPLLEHCDARQLTVADRLKIFLDICEAVGHAHANLVAHRDIKPQNVLVTDEGHPKLLDFGIAKVMGGDGLETTEQSSRFLTPAYASPEQLSGAPVGTATDIYSLGSLLFELLVGRPPFTVQDMLRNGALEPRRHGPDTPSSALRSATEADAKVRGTTLKRLGRQLRGDLNTIIGRCLQFDPGRRYSSVERLANDVKRHLDGLPIRARKARLGYRIGKLIRRNPFAVAAAASAAVALTVMLFAIVSSHQSVVRERDRAQAANRQAGEVTRLLTDILRLPDPYAGTRTDRQELSARQLLSFAREKVERELSGQPLVQARLMTSLGQVYVNLGWTEDGLTLLRTAHGRLEDLLGDEHPEVRNGLRQTGVALMKAGRAREAEPLLRQTLEQAQRLPRDPRGLAESLSAMSQVQMHAGDFDDAASSLRESLTQRGIDGQGASHRYARDTLALGWALWLGKRHSEAERALTHALELLRRTVGDVHPDVATANHRLGWVALRRQNFVMAESFFRRSLALRRRLHGDEHPETLTSMAALGEQFFARGEPTLAEPILRNVLRLERKVKGERHPDIAIDLHTLGQVVWDRGDPRAALPLFREACAIAGEAWGPDYRATIHYRRSLGLALLALEDTRAAEEVLSDTLKRARRRFGEDHRYFGFALAAWSEFLLARGRVTESLVAAERAVAVVRSALPSGSWRIGEVEITLGACLAAAGRGEAAERVLLGSLEKLESRPRPRLVRQTVRHLIDFYTAARRSERVDELRSRLQTSVDPGPFSSRSSRKGATASRDRSDAGPGDERRSTDLEETRDEAIHNHRPADDYAGFDQHSGLRERP